MKIENFIKELTSVLELDYGAIKDENSMLKGLYSSLGVLSIIAFCDRFFSTELTSAQLKSITTVKSLMEIIGIEKFEIN